MCSKDIKWHVAEHYSEMINRREEIAKALKLAKDPAKLVLDSIGRFFVQGSRTFRNPTNPHQDKQKAGRMAAILILECFVMISNDDGIEIAESDLECAAKAAVDWRKRMIREGGPGYTDEVDARGLLLLISGFGIQNHVFKVKDIMDLIRASNVKEITTALRR
ncbi:inactive protein FRIGIDA-like [Bidens hawaiensis]|uniref:inactive protein FRIGIDA-like n=1 Tax=Bidens hawaiensis TaxID=980011 RepID=UPI0040498963